MDKAAQEDGEGLGVALAPRVQPVPLEGVVAHGTLAVLQGSVRRGSCHVQLHEPTVPDAASHLRQVESVARQVLHRGGLALRCRGRDTQYAARLHPLVGTQGVGLHLRRLLHTHGRIRKSYTPPAQRDKARDATQAARTRVVSHGTDAGSVGQQRGGDEGVQARDEAQPTLRAGVQRTHQHDGGDVRRTIEEDDWQTETHGTLGQEQGIPRPGVLRHWQHIPRTERHRTSHQRLRARSG